MPLSPVTCGECATQMRLVEPTRDQRRKGRPAVWECPGCGSWCAARADGRPVGEPLGQRARAELHRARAAAHLRFDRLWLEGFVPSRTAAYAWLQSVLRKSSIDAHIACFDVRTCELVEQLAHDFVAAWRPHASPVLTQDPAELTCDGSDPDAPPKPPEPVQWVDESESWPDYPEVESDAGLDSEARAALFATLPPSYYEPMRRAHAPRASFEAHDGQPFITAPEDGPPSPGAAPYSSPPVPHGAPAGDELEPFVVPPDEGY